MQEVFVVTGLSGSGKSSALNMLEDLGFYCIDNLPVSLIGTTLNLLSEKDYRKIAISVDARDKESSERLSPTLDKLKNEYNINGIFLTASELILQRRYSETRRRHPFSFQENFSNHEQKSLTVGECIAREKLLLASLQGKFLTLDTSQLNPNDLKKSVFELVGGEKSRDSLVVVQSFSYRNGIPIDSDMVFDSRCLPNPYYQKDLQPLSGKDDEVISYLSSNKVVQDFLGDLYKFLDVWISAYLNKERSYITISIGCTGGRHRSVYCCEQVSKNLKKTWRVLTRHRRLG